MEQSESKSTLDLSNPSSWVPVAEAHQKYPDIFGRTEHRARWAVRHADTNGLTKARAIMRSGRQVLLHVPRYLAVMAGELPIDSQSGNSNALKNQVKSEACARDVQCRGDAEREVAA